MKQYPATAAQHHRQVLLSLTEAQQNLALGMKNFEHLKQRCIDAEKERDALADELYALKTAIKEGKDIKVLLQLIEPAEAVS